MGRQRRQKKKVPSNTTTHETKTEDKIVKEDRISGLPDEILIHILSSLKVREAQMTSLLSTRWRYLWTRITCLDFTNTPIMKRSRIVNWINKVCSSIQSPSIEQLMIEYNMFANAKDSLDILIHFAMKKGVKDLKLTMNTVKARCWRVGFMLSRCYISSAFKQLRSLNFKDVDISGETVAHFLLECSLLEQLSIQGCDNLGYLIVGGPFCNLKFLKILKNKDLKHLEICAPKLSSFQLQGCSKRINLRIDNVPLLSRVYIGGFGDCLTWAICELSSQLSQIQSLELCLKDNRQACHCESGCCAWGNMNFSPLSKLFSLRKLTVRRFVRDDENLLFLLSFLEVSPFLETYKVEIEFQDEYRQTTSLLEETNLALCQHQYLKVLEFANFVHHPKTIEFVKYIYRAAVILEKVVIDPLPSHRFSPPNLGRILFTKEFEELFEEVIRPGMYRRVEFVLVD